MTVVALVLYVASSLLQAVGAYGVIRDAVTGRRNMRQFKADWDQAAKIGWPEPAQEALYKYVTAENDVSDRRRWTAVGLLVGGLGLGAVANVVALYA
ncbi:hypothetical protein [Mycolicibacterium sp. HK-90]|uniref:hypothetical protein n=1 Tax=Mycolicibacterium sp. HK-90 TaxID=3056937 RepID=UPI002658B0F6|nr:hypothetical protein [Mycolicibacterium sp. HK-90]WKG01400.1 hypothetical protein QU592_19225 [Mycolicibacterium sp. HK-90]